MEEWDVENVAAYLKVLGLSSAAIDIFYGERVPPLAPVPHAVVLLLPPFTWHGWPHAKTTTSTAPCWWIWTKPFSGR